MGIFNKKPVIAAIAVVLVVAGAAGGALLFQNFNPFRDDSAKDAQDHAQAVKVVKKSKAFSYVELDKIMVSVPLSVASDGSASSIYRVCSVDMAFEINAKEKEKFTNVMPLIRSYAVQALSVHSYSEVRKVPLDQLQNDVSTRILSIAESQHTERPFNAAIITQLLCE
jgi:flagellar FliL protein